MKKIFHPSLFPWLTLGAGGLGFALRLWLYSTGVDDRGLLVSHHPASVLSLVLTALFLGVLLLCVSNLQPQKKAALLFPPSVPGALGWWLGGAGLIWAGIREFSAVNTILGPVILFMCIAGGLSAFYLGFCRLRHLRPAEAAHIPFLLAAILLLISHYRLWSARPQLQDYLFELLAGIFIMLSAFHRAAVCVRADSQRRYLFTNQAALFFCCLSLKGLDPVFHAAMAVWLTTNLCTQGAAAEDTI